MHIPVCQRNRQTRLAAPGIVQAGSTLLRRCPCAVLDRNMVTAQIAGVGRIEFQRDTVCDSIVGAAAAGARGKPDAKSDPTTVRAKGINPARWWVCLSPGHGRILNHESNAVGGTKRARVTETCVRRRLAYLKREAGREPTSHRLQCIEPGRSGWPVVARVSLSTWVGVTEPVSVAPEKPEKAIWKLVEVGLRTVKV